MKYYANYSMKKIRDGRYQILKHNKNKDGDIKNIKVYDFKVYDFHGFKIINYRSILDFMNDHKDFYVHLDYFISKFSNYAAEEYSQRLSKILYETLGEKVEKDYIKKGKAKYEAIQIAAKVVNNALWGGSNDKKINKFFKRWIWGKLRTLAKSDPILQSLIDKENLIKSALIFSGIHWESIDLTQVVKKGLSEDYLEKIKKFEKDYNNLTFIRNYCKNLYKNSNYNQHIPPITEKTNLWESITCKKRILNKNKNAAWRIEKIKPSKIKNKILSNWPKNVVTLTEHAINANFYQYTDDPLLLRFYLICNGNCIFPQHLIYENLLRTDKPTLLAALRDFRKITNKPGRPSIALMKSMLRYLVDASNFRIHQHVVNELELDLDLIEIFENKKRKLINAKSVRKMLKYAHDLHFLNEKILVERERIMLERKKEKVEKRKTEFFPAPVIKPFFESNGIKFSFIESYGELISEAIKMRNCVENYKNQIDNGEYLLFVAEKEDKRAHISLSLSQRHFSIEQCYEMLNKKSPFCKEVEKSISSWLNKLNNYLNGLENPIFKVSTVGYNQLMLQEREEREEDYFYAAQNEHELEDVAL